MLAGHIDMSATLVARLEPAQQVDLHQAMFSFFRPFSNGLWFCLLGLVVIAGAVDYVLERRSNQGAQLGWSMFEVRSQAQTADT